MKSTFGKNITVSIWGGSHEPAIGVDIEGLPQETDIDMNQLAAFLKRRAPGNSPFTTKRKEPDVPVPTGGLTPTDGSGSGASQGHPAPNTPNLWRITGNTVSLEIRNTDTRSADYKSLRTVPRPGHADYTARLRYGNDLNMAGGGPFSARMTAPLCMAGGIALQILQKRGITIGAHIYSVADIADTPFDPVTVNAGLLDHLKKKDFSAIDGEAARRMQERITAARMDLDSVGGIVEVCALGLPAGIGGAMYDGLESALAPIFFGIPAVKGVEFGAGFGATRLKGSENNDPFYYPEPGDPLYVVDDGGHSNASDCTACVRTRTNNHGGILGGITTGMPLIARLAFKPTPSISREQDSVDLETKQNTKLIIKGRHDPCVVVRAVPIVEAALALGILDCMMETRRNPND